MSNIQFTNLVGQTVTAEVISISGEVIEINRSNQTRLHASGGGAYASSHNGHSSASVSPISVSSTNSVHDDVYILTESGEEVFIQLVNWENAGIRKGHHIQALWLKGTVDNKKPFSSPYLAVNNRSLNKVLYNEAGIYTLLSSSSIIKTILVAFMKANIFMKIWVGISIFLATTIILSPILGITVMFMVKGLEYKLPVLANQEIKPKLNEFLLPAIGKMPQQ